MVNKTYVGYYYSISFFDLYVHVTSCTVSEILRRFMELREIFLCFQRLYIFIPARTERFITDFFLVDSIQTLLREKSVKFNIGLFLTINMLPIAYSQVELQQSSHAFMRKIIMIIITIIIITIIIIIVIITISSSTKYSFICTKMEKTYIKINNKYVYSPKKDRNTQEKTSIYIE